MGWILREVVKVRLSLLILLGLVGCLPKSEQAGQNPVPSSSPERDVLELLGTWQYTGGLAPLTNTMEFSEAEMLDSGDYDGTDWAITWRIDSWDNDTDRALLNLVEVEGFSRYEVGDALFATWQVEGNSGDFYFSKDDYVEPGGGTEGDEFFTFTRQ